MPLYRLKRDIQRNFSRNGDIVGLYGSRGYTGVFDIVYGHIVML